MTSFTMQESVQATLGEVISYPTELQIREGAYIT